MCSAMSIVIKAMEDEIRKFHEVDPIDKDQKLAILQRMYKSRLARIINDTIKPWQTPILVKLFFE